MNVIFQRNMGLCTVVPNHLMGIGLWKTAQTKAKDDLKQFFDNRRHKSSIVSIKEGDGSQRWVRLPQSGEKVAVSLALSNLEHTQYESAVFLLTKGLGRGRKANEGKLPKSAYEDSVIFIASKDSQTMVSVPEERQPLTLCEALERQAKSKGLRTDDGHPTVGEATSPSYLKELSLAWQILREKAKGEEEATAFEKKVCSVLSVNSDLAEDQESSQKERAVIVGLIKAQRKILESIGKFEGMADEK